MALGDSRIMGTIHLQVQIVFMGGRHRRLWAFMDQNRYLCDASLGSLDLMGLQIMASANRLSGGTER